MGVVWPSELLPFTLSIGEKREREGLVLMQVKGRRKMDSPDATTKTVTLVPQ